MTFYEVDIRDRETGNSIITVYSGSDYDKAYRIVNEFNSEWYEKDWSNHFFANEPIESYMPEVKIWAEIVYCDTKEQMHGVGKWTEEDLENL